MPIRLWTTPTGLLHRAIVAVMTTVIRAASAPDFLALVPRLLGFVPERSVVLVPFAGNRTLGAMRLDLPDTVDRDEIDRVASTFIGMVCKVAHVDALAVVVFTDTPVGRAEALPHDALVGALLTRADLCGLRASDALCLAPDAWGSYLDPALPRGGRSLDAIPFDDPAFSDLPVRRGGQGAGAALPAADPAERARVARALDRLEAALQTVAAEILAVEGEDPDEDTDDGAGAHGAEMESVDLFVARLLVEDAPLFFEDVLDGDVAAPPAEQLAGLLWALSRPVLRDVALVQWASDLAHGDEAMDAQLTWTHGDPFPPDLGRIMWGEGAAPDAERLERALGMTRRALSAAPRAMRPGPFAACAWLAWALGNSTHAAAYARNALAIDPDHGMAQIVQTYVAAAHLPEWAFDRPRPPRTPVSRLVDSGGLEG
jgi:hypothetical protein